MRRATTSARRWARSTRPISPSTTQNAFALSSSAIAPTAASVKTDALAEDLWTLELVGAVLKPEAENVKKMRSEKEEKERADKAAREDKEGNARDDEMDED